MAPRHIKMGNVVIAKLLISTDGVNVSSEESWIRCRYPWLIYKAKETHKITSEWGSAFTHEVLPMVNKTPGTAGPYGHLRGRRNLQRV